jgi:hypothetical protein
MQRAVQLTVRCTDIDCKNQFFLTRIRRSGRELRHMAESNERVNCHVAYRLRYATEAGNHYKSIRSRTLDVTVSMVPARSLQLAIHIGHS